MDDKQFQIVLKDYENTQAFIDKIGKYLFQVRNWAIISSSGVIAYAVSEKYGWILIANLFIIAGFMFIELFQKSFHEDALEKLHEMEEIIQKCCVGSEPLPKDYFFGLGHSIFPVYPKRIYQILFAPSRWHNFAFYIFLVLATLGARLLISFIC